MLLRPTASKSLSGKAQETEQDFANKVKAWAGMDNRTQDFSQAVGMTVG
jgi:hypothetical protein